MFTVRIINLDCTAIDDAAGRTVAYVTPQGWVDWLLREPDQPGAHLESIDKETHLGNVRGLKFHVHVQHPHTNPLRRPDVQLTEGGRSVIVSARSEAGDGSLRADYRAELTIAADTGRYIWSLVSRVTCTSPAPLDLRWIEYNNILPADTGGRFLFERRKKFKRFLIEDRDGVVWDFPHQHVLDYRPYNGGGERLPIPLRGAAGNWGGFFGEAFNPVLTVDACDGEPCWGICDAYLDFHCCTRFDSAMQPGVTRTWRYHIHWLDEARATQLQANTRRYPVTEADWKERGGARLGLGFNDFRKSIQLDGVDEGSAFIPDGRERFWEKQGGPDGHGLVTMVSTRVGETIWPAAIVNPTQMPPASRLRIRGKMRVAGAGRMFFRLRPHIFSWRPTPHVDWLPVVCSPPLGDTAGRWVDFAVPEYSRTAQQVDTELAVELVLDGPATASLSALDVVLDDL